MRLLGIRRQRQRSRKISLFQGRASGLPQPPSLDGKRHERLQIGAAARAHARTAKTRQAHRALMRGAQSALAFDEEEQFLQPSRGLMERGNVARGAGRLDFLVQIDGLLPVFRVHLAQQSARTLQQTL